MKPDAQTKLESRSPPGKVLLYAPTNNDARITRELLTGKGYDIEICSSIGEIRAMADEECGCIILAEETLHMQTVPELAATLQDQPSWSDIPVIIVTSGGEPTRETLRRLTLLSPGGNISLLERPFRPNTLISAVAVALKSRSRQFQVHQLLTQLNSAKMEAEAANTAKDVFLATLSHELRTPLNPVLMIASIGASDPTLPAQVREDYSVIRKNVKLEAKLIDDLLDLTRIAKGKIQLEKAPCDVHKILKDALENLQAEMHEKGIQLVKHFEATSSCINGDVTKVQQIFWNVIRNAIKFAAQDGTVSIKSLTTSDRKIRIAVTDSGIGLSEEELECIFEAFAQGEHANGKTASPYGGLGLGLSISKMLVELHHGMITAKSDGLGQGATFTIELPLLEPAACDAGSPREISPEPSAKSHADRPKVLLVEDHIDTLSALSVILKKKYEVVTATTASEAKEAAAAQEFDFVISDIGLPDENGYALMNFLRKEHGLKGIALTGYGMEEDVAHSREAGFLAHLIKPVEYEELDEALAKHLPRD